MILGSNLVGKLATKFGLQSTCSGLGSSGLPDLDEIAVRVTHVAANLSAMVLWLGQEFGTSASPLLIRDPDIRDTNIQETGNLIGVLRGTKRHSGFIVGWAATDVHNQPTIGKLDDGGFATANNMASENAHIELRRTFHICDGQKVCQDKAFFGRQLMAFSVDHSLFPFFLVPLALSLCRSYSLFLSTDKRSLLLSLSANGVLDMLIMYRYYRDRLKRHHRSLSILHEP